MKPAQVARCHPFVADPDLPPDMNGRRVCGAPGCGLPEANAHHDTAELDEEQAAARRRIGDE